MPSWVVRGARGTWRIAFPAEEGARAAVRKLASGGAGVIYCLQKTSRDWQCFREKTTSRPPRGGQQLPRPRLRNLPKLNQSSNRVSLSYVGAELADSEPL